MSRWCLKIITSQWKRSYTSSIRSLNVDACFKILFHSTSPPQFRYVQIKGIKLFTKIW